VELVRRRKLMRWSSLILGALLLIRLVPAAQAQEEKEKTAEEKERCICIEPFETVRVLPRLNDLQASEMAMLSPNWVG
jgi:hypothetical protein